MASLHGVTVTVTWKTLYWIHLHKGYVCFTRTKLTSTLLLERLSLSSKQSEYIFCQYFNRVNASMLYDYVTQYIDFISLKDYLKKAHIYLLTYSMFPDTTKRIPTGWKVTLWHPCPVLNIIVNPYCLFLKSCLLQLCCVVLVLLHFSAVLLMDHSMILWSLWFTLLTWVSSGRKNGDIEWRDRGSDR